MPFDRPIRLGTRGSPLALIQAGRVRDRLLASLPGMAEDRIEIVPIRTTGDAVQNRRLADIGGKGLFSKEIEHALATGRIDLAVHSMKDVETVLDPRFTLAAVTEREDPRDVLLCAVAASIRDLPRGAVVGTSSLRRQAQVLHLRPDVEVVLFRGNVDTRLAKLDAGAATATMLALAGLVRLGRMPASATVIEPEEMLPAAGQGAIGVECRADDLDILAILGALDDPVARAEVTAERSLLAALDGSCRTPIAALARVRDGRLTLTARLAAPDGSRLWEAHRSGAVAEAAALGGDAGAELRRLGDTELFR